MASQIPEEVVAAARAAVVLTQALRVAMVLLVL
jgi:hypothetical protein